ncbi:FadR/GntR family transcriptional regulator [Propioniciclava soli]|uniref:FadR/GntR family transcriptional regulator n=1 Tax=Propioniciclava soli TaxID=2775081 RepID=UPI001E63B75A|nr:FadR/GntR family transcriptional regulator [Propioniciclava soli]
MQAPDATAVLPRPRSISGDVAARLERHIATDLSPGDRLPPERELCTTFGISRATLREAMHALEGRGLVERRPGRGTTVLAPPPDALGVQFVATQGASAAEIAHVVELRRTVEPAVAELAARRATDLDLALLEQTLLESHAGLTASEALELDIRFHEQLAAATGNPLLASVCEAMNHLVHDVRLRSHVSRSGRRNSIEGHHRLYACVAAHDAAGAKQAMLTHLGEVADVLAGLDALLAAEASAGAGGGAA